MQDKKNPTYFIVLIKDTRGLLPFGEKYMESLQDRLKEEMRLKAELKQFRLVLEKYFNEGVTYIGEGKQYGKHIERYLFEKGGFMELMLESPVVVKADFVNKKRAESFCDALKQTLKEIMPEHPNKLALIGNIAAEEVKDDILPIQKWAKLHKKYLQKSVIFTVVIVFFAGIILIVQEVFEYIQVIFFHSSSLFASLIAAVISTILFLPVKATVDKYVCKYLIK